MNAAAPALTRRRLPIGIQTFAYLRNTDCYYVDKTGLAIDLIESSGKGVFPDPAAPVRQEPAGGHVQGIVRG